ncbi:MAG: hypothetical protein ACRD82_04930, partial [Blastocatellia bacterium]
VMLAFRVMDAKLTQFNGCLCIDTETPFQETDVNPMVKRAKCAQQPFASDLIREAFQDNCNIHSLF